MMSEPQQGRVSGDFRVLVTKADELPVRLVTVVGELFGEWKVTVLTSDSSEVIAEHVVRGKGPAQRRRDEFITAAAAEGLDRTDAERVGHLLRE